MAEHCHVDCVEGHVFEHHERRHTNVLHCGAERTDQSWQYAMRCWSGPHFVTAGEGNYDVPDYDLSALQ